MVKAGDATLKVYLAHSFDDLGQDAMQPSDHTRCLEGFFRKMEESDVTVLDPENTTIPWSEYQRRFKYCLDEIRNSDVLIVDATSKLGIGAGAEMMYAQKLDIKIFAICPECSHYRKPVPGQPIETEWIHPFIHGLATRIFGSFDECTQELTELSRVRGSNYD